MSGNQIHVFGEAAGHKGTDGPNRVRAHKRPKRSHPTKKKSAHYFSVVLVRGCSLNATFGVCTYPTWGPPQGLCPPTASIQQTPFFFFLFFPLHIAQFNNSFGVGSFFLALQIASQNIHGTRSLLMVATTS
ncbi:hypothetical protein VNO80_26761 [Phaseolus coccineus]|uniref:Uncharacterized protein n=1 Tax=Phaseolus coccineus TaxID=3886 RepID=A0AAN9LFF2_PHACN